MANIAMGMMNHACGDETSEGEGGRRGGGGGGRERERERGTSKNCITTRAISP